MSLKILTVDDSKMVRMIVKKAFAPYGCQVHEAASGTEGLAMALALRPDLIFLDITMSDMNGLVMLEKIRENEALQVIPVVMLTAESGNSSVERADQLGVVGYVSKPFKHDRLLTIAGEILALQPLPSS